MKVPNAVNHQWVFDLSEHRYQPSRNHHVQNRDGMSCERQLFIVLTITVPPSLMSRSFPWRNLCTVTANRLCKKSISKCPRSGVTLTETYIPCTSTNLSEQYLDKYSPRKPIEKLLVLTLNHWQYRTFTDHILPTFKTFRNHLCTKARCLSRN